jgi:hypothetical protein
MSTKEKVLKILELLEKGMSKRGKLSYAAAYHDLRIELESKGIDESYRELLEQEGDN